MTKIEKVGRKLILGKKVRKKLEREVRVKNRERK